MSDYKAEFDFRQAYLDTDFGEQITLKWTGLTIEQLEQLVGGRKIKGVRAGRLRGYVWWMKCTRGGWVKTGSYDWDAGRGSGFVCRQVGSTVAKIVFNKDGKEVWAAGDEPLLQRMRHQLCTEVPS